MPEQLSNIIVSLNSVVPSAVNRMQSRQRSPVTAYVVHIRQECTKLRAIVDVTGFGIVASTPRVTWTWAWARDTTKPVLEM